MTTGDAPGTFRLEHTWDRAVRWWDAVYYCALALAAASFLVGGLPGRPLVLGLLCIAVVALAYATFGARGARTREPALTRPYLVVLVLGVSVANTQQLAATLLLFAAFAHIWMMTPTPREGVVFSVALTVGTWLGFGVRTDWDAEVLLIVAPQLGVGLVFAIALGYWVALTMRQSEANARLVDELRAAQAELARSHHEAGVTAERERLAREIHDTLAQGFTSVVMQAQAASAALDRRDTEGARRRLAVVEDTARDNLAEARALVAAFAPAPLQDASLPQALVRLGDRFSQESGVLVGVKADPGIALTPAAEVVLLRAAQEALANVRRHAGARSVVVLLALDEGDVALLVSDDGRGLAAGATEGFGLAGMRERVTAAGGTVELGVSHLGGTALLVRLPIEPADPEVDR